MILAALLLSQQVAGAATTGPSPAPSEVAAAITQQIEAAPKRGAVMPKLLYRPPMARFYPAASVRAGEQGEAMVRCTLRPTGTLDACTVMLSSGFAALDAASLQWMSEARYVPQIVNRKPVESDVIMPVHWAIEP
jgi:TonB family protein